MNRTTRVALAVVWGAAAFYMNFGLPSPWGSLMAVAWMGLLILIVLGAGYLSMRRSMLRLVNQEYRLEWLEQVGPLARSPQVTALHERLESLGYRHAGDYRSIVLPHPGSFTACYLHPVEPIYALVQVIPTNRVLVLVNLFSYFDGGAALLSTNSPWAGSMNLPRPAETPYLVQQRVRGTAEALHGQHVGTLHAWISGGRLPLPATREALEERGRAQIELSRSYLAQRGGITVGDYARILFRARGGNVLRF